MDFPELDPPFRKMARPADEDSVIDPEAIAQGSASRGSADWRTEALSPTSRPARLATDRAEEGLCSRLRKSHNSKKVSLPPLTFGCDFCKPAEGSRNGCDCTLKNDPFAPFGGPRGKG